MMDNLTRAIIAKFGPRSMRVGKREALIRARIKDAQAKGVRYCKTCGCTESSACWDRKLVSGCCWVSEDECSVCRPDLLKKLLRRKGSGNG